MHKYPVLNVHPALFWAAKDLAGQSEPAEESIALSV